MARAPALVCPRRKVLWKKSRVGANLLGAVGEETQKVHPGFRVVRIVRVLSREEPQSAADHVADEPGPTAVDRIPEAAAPHHAGADDALLSDA